LKDFGFQDRISLGGWIARRVGPGQFGDDTVAVFPEVKNESSTLVVGRPLQEPGRGLHTICSTFYQIGIKSFFCSLQLEQVDQPDSFSWKAVRLGTPIDEPWCPLSDALGEDLGVRPRPYNPLRYHTDVSRIPA